MDGEHAFSASLTLVMVNFAFPYNERDARAMETALTVLRGMAEKGNEYIQARLALLMNLRGTIGRRSPRTGPQEPGPQPGPASLQQESDVVTEDLQSVGLPLEEQPVPTVQDAMFQLTTNFQPFQDVSLDFQTEDDPQFWEEIYGEIDIDMETGWIENALRNEVPQNQWNI